MNDIIHKKTLEELMAHDFIYDQDGKNIAWIDDNNVFSSTTRKKIAIVRNGNICALDGKVIGHLEDADAVSKKRYAVSEAFTKLTIEP